MGVGDADRDGDADAEGEDVPDADAEACGVACPEGEPGLTVPSGAVTEGVGWPFAGEA